MSTARSRGIPQWKRWGVALEPPGAVCFEGDPAHHSDPGNSAAERGAVSVPCLWLVWDRQPVESERGDPPLVLRRFLASLNRSVFGVAP